MFRQRIFCRNLLILLFAFLAMIIAPHLMPVAASQSSASAATYYVSTTGDNANPGTLARPWLSPGYASRQLQSGDTLVILGGRYVISQFDADIMSPPSGAAGNPTVIKGEPGNRSVIAGGGNLFSAMLLGGRSYVTIENLEITSDNGAAFRDGIDAGSGLAEHIVLRDLYIHNIDEFGLNLGDVNDISIDNCHITYCGFGAIGGPAGTAGGLRNMVVRDCELSYSGHYYQGGPGPGPYDRPDGFGIEPSDGPIEIVNTISEHNRGDGLDSKASNTYIHECVVANNSCDGVKLWGGGSKVENTLIYGTGDGVGGGSPWAGVVIGNDTQAGAAFELINVTVRDNPTRQAYPMYVQYDSLTPINLTMRNTIVSNGFGLVYIGDSVTLTADHNLFFRPAGGGQVYANRREYTAEEIGLIGAGNLSADPRFVNPAWGSTGDYHTSPGSPAIDAGTASGAPSYDLEGIARPRGPAFDIGVYETANPTINNPYKNYTYNYRGNLHAHSNNGAGGTESPSVVSSWYKNNGYAFYSITDHDKVTSNPGTAGILWLGGGEEDTSDGSSGHMGHNGIVSPVISGTDQFRIDSAIAQGGFTILHHPARADYAGWTAGEISQLNNVLALEIFNGGSDLDSTVIWDSVLTSGKTVWGAAGDDSHSAGAHGDGYIVVNSASADPTAAEIKTELRAGNFYASRGGDVSITVNNLTITASTTVGSGIRWIKNPGGTFKTTAVQSDTYTVVGDEGYVRVEILNGGGAPIAWSQPIRIEGADGGDPQLPSSNRGYIISLYRTLLHRTGTLWTDDMQPWLNALNNGSFSREGIAYAMMTSHEYHMRMVRGMYRVVLGREANLGEQHMWANGMDAGLTLRSMRAQIYGSQEFAYTYPSSFAYVEFLYTKILNRSASDPGAQGWVNALNNGSMSRSQTAYSIMCSDEYYTGYITSKYVDILGRAPEPGGLASWLGGMRGGMTEEVLPAQLYGSYEYFTTHANI